MDNKRAWKLKGSMYRTAVCIEYAWGFGPVDPLSQRLKCASGSWYTSSYIDRGHKGWPAYNLVTVRSDRVYNELRA